jgi:hypothetical protein
LYAIAIGIKNSDWKSGLEMASLDWKNFQIGPKLSDKTTVTRAIELLTKALNQAASTQATAESKSRRLLGKYLVQIAPIILNFQSSLTLSADFFMIAGRTIFDPDDEKCLTYCFE